MNKFTQKLAEVIKDLAAAYWESDCRPVFGDGWPPEHMEKIKENYVKAILIGLADPEYWGLDKPVFGPLD